MAVGGPPIARIGRQTRVGRGIVRRASAFSQLRGPSIAAPASTCPRAQIRERHAGMGRGENARDPLGRRDARRRGPRARIGSCHLEAPIGSRVRGDDRDRAGFYGILDASALAGMRLGASLEGTITAPVYEGKSLAGRIDLVGRREIPATSTVLYAHLGGQPALSACAGLFT